LWISSRQSTSPEAYYHFTFLLVTTEPFLDPDDGDFHSQSRWQISRQEGFTSDLVLDRTSTEHLTELLVQGKVLEPNVAYYVRVHFYDANSKGSEWSDPVEFSTISTVVDFDSDGISDDEQTEIYGTDPSKVDTDDDSINDGAELAYWGNYWNADYDGDGLLNLLDSDADEDGFPDGLELVNGSDPADARSTP